MGYAAILAVIGGVFGLLFMGCISVGDNWYSYSSSIWMGGHW
jgi:hypothetical protein